MTYLEILATIYVIANSGFIVNAIFRDKIIVDKKIQMDNLVTALDENRKALRDVSRLSARQQEELFKLRNFYNSHNSNKSTEVKNEP